MFKSLFLVVVMMFLSACGFHLADKGEFSSELNYTYVDATYANKDLHRSIEKNLRANGLNVSSKEEATAMLTVLSEETDKEVLTLDNDGKAREYELLLRVKFNVQRPDKSILLKEQSIELSRDFVFEKSDLLGANEEEEALYKEMRSDAARLIMYRLQTI